MSAKQKLNTKSQRSIITLSVAVLGFIVGLILFLDGFIFHWFGDLSTLDPTGSPVIHHWHLGLFMMVFSCVMFYLDFKE